MAITEADRKRMGTPIPSSSRYPALETDPFPDLSGGKPNPSPQDIRKNRAEHLAKLRHLYPIPGPIPDHVTETEHAVKARDGYDIPIRIHVPTAKPEKGSPLLVMFHEGGWSKGDLTDEDLNCRLFARDFGGVAVNVDYRLAPEWKFPTGLNDCWDVVKWCAVTANPSFSILPADPQLGFIVGGASAGGNLSAALCQIARDGGLNPRLTGQYLCVPALLWHTVVPDEWKSAYRSRTESVQDPIFKLEARSDRTTEILNPDVASPRFSPLLHPNLKRLPAAFFQLSGLDPLRDEGLPYERVLREENGVPTKLVVYDGFGHMFHTNWPKLETSQRFAQDTREGFAWLLETGSGFRKS